MGDKATAASSATPHRPPPPHHNLFPLTTTAVASGTALYPTYCCYSPRGKEGLATPRRARVAVVCVSPDTSTCMQHGERGASPTNDDGDVGNHKNKENFKCRDNNNNKSDMGGGGGGGGGGIGELPPLFKNKSSKSSRASSAASTGPTTCTNDACCNATPVILFRDRNECETMAANNMRKTNNNHHTHVDEDEESDEDHEDLRASLGIAPSPPSPSGSHLHSPSPVCSPVASPLPSPSCPHTNNNSNNNTPQASPSYASNNLKTSLASLDEGGSLGRKGRDRVEDSQRNGPRIGPSNDVTNAHQETCKKRRPPPISLPTGTDDGHRPISFDPLLSPTQSAARALEEEMHTNKKSSNLL